MGCDIHGYLEWRDAGLDWRDFSGRIHLSRNYSIFEALAGVRGEESKAIVPVRGFPADASWEVKEQNICRILQEEREPKSGECSPSQAQRWVREKSSSWVDAKLIPVPTPDNGELADFEGAMPAYKAVTHPDWHSHSWLSAEELVQALRLSTTPQNNPQYYAVLAAMRQFVVAGKEARFVFWFDN